MPRNTRQCPFHSIKPQGVPFNQTPCNHTDCLKPLNNHSLNTICTVEISPRPSNLPGDWLGWLSVKLKGSPSSSSSEGESQIFKVRVHAYNEWETFRKRCVDGSDSTKGIRGFASPHDSFDFFVQNQMSNNPSVSNQNNSINSSSSSSEFAGVSNSLPMIRIQCKLSESHGDTRTTGRVLGWQMPMSGTIRDTTLCFYWPSKPSIKKSAPKVRFAPTLEIATNEQFILFHGSKNISDFSLSASIEWNEFKQRKTKHQVDNLPSSLSDQNIGNHISIDSTPMKPKKLKKEKENNNVEDFDDDGDEDFEFSPTKKVKPRKQIFNLNEKKRSRVNVHRPTPIAIHNVNASLNHFNGNSLSQANKYNKYTPLPNLLQRSNEHITNFPSSESKTIVKTDSELIDVETFKNNAIVNTFNNFDADLYSLPSLFVPANQEILSSMSVDPFAPQMNLDLDNLSRLSLGNSIKNVNDADHGDIDMVPEPNNNEVETEVDSSKLNLFRSNSEILNNSSNVANNNNVSPSLSPSHKKPKQNISPRQSQIKVGVYGGYGVGGLSLDNDFFSYSNGIKKESIPTPKYSNIFSNHFHSSRSRSHTPPPLGRTFSNSNNFTNNNNYNYNQLDYLNSSSSYTSTSILDDTLNNFSNSASSINSGNSMNMNNNYPLNGSMAVAPAPVNSNHVPGWDDFDEYDNTINNNYYFTDKVKSNELSAPSFLAPLGIVGNNTNSNTLPLKSQLSRQLSMESFVSNALTA